MPCKSCYYCRVDRYGEAEYCYALPEIIDLKGRFRSCIYYKKKEREQYAHITRISFRIYFDDDLFKDEIVWQS